MVRERGRHRRDRHGGEYDAGVRGEIQNVSGERIPYLELEIDFLNADGEKIAGGIDNFSLLAAEQIWEFDAGLLAEDPDDVTAYEIQVV